MLIKCNQKLNTSFQKILPFRRFAELFAFTLGARFIYTIMKEAYYFSHDNNARRDPKLITLRSEYGKAGCYDFWIIIEVLSEQGGEIDIELFYNCMIFELQMSKEEVKNYVEFLLKIGLLTLYKNKILSKRLKKTLKIRNELSQKRSQSVKIRWDKYKENKIDADNTNVLQMNNKSNTNVIQLKERKGNERKGKEIKEKEKKEEEREISEDENLPPSFKGLNLKKEEELLKAKKDFIDDLLGIFAEEYKKARQLDFILINAGKERAGIGKLLKNFRTRNKGKDSEATKKEFHKFFRSCLEIGDNWHYIKMSPNHIASNLNEIKTLLKTKVPVVRKEPGEMVATDEEREHWNKQMERQHEQYNLP